MHTTFLTGMLSAVAHDLVSWRADGDRQAAERLRLQGGIVIVYLAGTALGGLVVVGTIGAGNAGPPVSASR